MAATILLGVATREPRRLALDVRAGQFFHGRGTNLAWIFTVTGYGPTLSATYAAFFVLALALHRSILELCMLTLTQMLSQFSAGRLKLVFKRLRPEKWLKRQEHDSSFPSGHATTAAVTFAGIVLLVWRSSLPHDLKVAASIPPACFALGIGWSRLVLGAHYLSDVLGGYAFGAAWLCAMLAVLEGYGV